MESSKYSRGTNENIHYLFYMTPPFCFVSLLNRIPSLTFWGHHIYGGHVDRLRANAWDDKSLSD